jgi:hypothetical protein
MNCIAHNKDRGSSTRPAHEPQNILAENGKKIQRCFLFGYIGQYYRWEDRTTQATITATKHDSFKRCSKKE